MSRSLWALAETGRRFSATKYTVIMLAACLFVMAAKPAMAAAATRHADSTHPSAAPARQADPIALEFGSGYGGGSTATAVRRLQRRLDGLGDFPGPIDGRYGPRTEQAVERFQSAHGLRVDGIAGPITQAALRAPSVVLFPGAGYGGPGSNAVRGLQRRLGRDGYSTGPIDGRYGPLTTRAVRRFQAAHGLRVDGIAGPQTFRTLNLGVASRGPSTHPIPTTRPKAPKTVSPQRPRRTIHPTPHPRPHPKSSHTSTPQAIRPRASSIPVLLVLAGLIVLAALAGGVWLVARRRRELTTAVPPPQPGPAVVAQPEAAEDPMALGAQLLERGDEAGAIRAFRSADENGHAAAASNLGVLLEGQGDLAGAEAAYRRADARGSADGAFNLASLLIEQGETEEAIAAYERAAGRGDAGAAATVGLLLYERGDEDAAEAALTRAAARGHVGSMVSLGVLLERRGDVAGAEAAYHEADVRDSADGAFNLAALLEQRGDLANAVVAYQRADARGDAAAALHVGMLLERRTDYHNALEAYRRAEQSAQPDIAEAARSRAHALALALGLSLDPRGGGR